MKANFSCHLQKSLLPQIFLEGSPGHREIHKIWRGALDQFSRLKSSPLPLSSVWTTTSLPLCLCLSRAQFGRVAQLPFCAHSFQTPFCASFKAPSFRTYLGILPSVCPPRVMRGSLTLGLPLAWCLHREGGQAVRDYPSPDVFQRPFLALPGSPRSSLGGLLLSGSVLARACLLQGTLPPAWAPLRGRDTSLHWIPANTATESARPSCVPRHLSQQMQRL